LFDDSYQRRRKWMNNTGLMLTRGMIAVIGGAALLLTGLG
jgi:hypothetical protein